MKTKEKVQKLRQHQNRTGGGPPSSLTLTEFDQQILRVIGESCADGDSNLNEIGFDEGKFYEKLICKSCYIKRSLSFEL